MLLDIITNGFVGSTFNVFSHKDLKKCAYIYSVISVKNLTCKGNVKSMYSDYASGIAFLIKNKLLNQIKRC